MHPSDLANQIQTNTHGALARLAAQGTIYSNAFLKNAPADSFPGLAALVTGTSLFLSHFLRQGSARSFD